MTQNDPFIESWMSQNHWLEKLKKRKLAQKNGLSLKRHENPTKRLFRLLIDKGNF